jgi:hypothetical protein
MVQTMYGEKCAQQLRNVRLPKNMASRRSADISETVEKRLIEELRSKRISTETDEATNWSRDSVGAEYKSDIETTLSKSLMVL